MKTCDSCGEPLNNDHPFITCTKCLFGGVLADSLPEDAPPSPTASPPPPLPPGLEGLFPRRDFLDKYDILERLADGGQGSVWKVWDFEFRRIVAMKRLDAKALSAPPQVYRFLAEAQITSQLQHPGILPIFDIGIDPEGLPFYTTQLLSGQNFLEIWCHARQTDGARLSIRRALELLLRVCEIMAHAHDRGVIHRDLKPPNILAGPFGDVRVIDWGSAHVLRSAKAGVEEPFVALHQFPVQTSREQAIREETDLGLPTAASGLPTTILFTAPEHLAEDMGEFGPRTDIYSLGVMLYELLARRLPYSDAAGKLPEGKVLKASIKHGPPPTLRSIRPSVSRDLAAICEKAMAHERADRYESMPELAADIRAAIELRPVKARRPGLVLKTQRLAQRNAGYVALISVIFLAITVGFAVSGRLKRQRDVARQVQALRDAELAARNGQWLQSLRHLEEAQSAGYGDAVDLGLHRAEAWTVLNQPDRAGAELRNLMRRSDLGRRRGVVLLNMGDYELFDKSTAEQGQKHVREAQIAGLGRADQFVAAGLLADSVPQSLASFQEALRINPFSYTAHIHSMGMEFVLGHHSELAAHIHVFEILYPDDPSPRFLEASEYALGGQAEEAVNALEPLRKSMPPASWDRLILGHRKLADAAQCFSLDGFLKGDAFDTRKLNKLMSEAGAVLAASLPVSTTGEPRLREPHLPCLEHGLLDGVLAVQALASPFYRDITPAIDQIKSGWRLCPVAVLPFRAAMLLEARQPPLGSKDLPLLAIQSQLFQLAADSPSFVPGVPRTSRYMAAKAELQLIHNQSASSTAARQDCLHNLRAAAESREASPLECRDYFAMACELGDLDSAKQLLDHWEKAAPAEAELQRKRVDLAIQSGNFGAAIPLLDHLLARDAADPWALRQRQAVVEKLEAALARIRSPRVETQAKKTGK